MHQLLSWILHWFYKGLCHLLFGLKFITNWPTIDISPGQTEILSSHRFRHIRSFYEISRWHITGSPCICIMAATSLKRFRRIEQLLDFSVSRAICCFPHCLRLGGLEHLLDLSFSVACCFYFLPLEVSVEWSIDLVAGTWFVFNGRFGSSVLSVLCAWLSFYFINKEGIEVYGFIWDYWVFLDGLILLRIII